MGVVLEGRLAELEKEAAKLRAEQKKKADMHLEVLAFQRLQEEQKAQQTLTEQADVRESEKNAMLLKEERLERRRVEGSLNEAVRRLRTDVEALRAMNNSLQGKLNDP